MVVHCGGTKTVDSTFDQAISQAQAMNGCGVFFLINNPWINYHDITILYTITHTSTPHHYLENVSGILPLEFFCTLMVTTQTKSYFTFSL